MKPDGSLIVRAPNRTTKSEADAFVNKHEKWVENHRKKMGERKAQAQSVQRLTQAELLALGRLAKKVIPERVAYYAKKNERGIRQDHPALSENPMGELFDQKEPELQYPLDADPDRGS